MPQNQTSTSTHLPDGDQQPQTKHRVTGPKGPWVKYYYDRHEAERVVRFIETRLIHFEGQHAGKPFILEGWERRLVKKLFGWRRRSDGTRRYRVLFLFLPRKNGKTSLGAAIALYLMYADREMAAQVACAASDKEQAKIVFNMAAAMVLANPLLTSMSKVWRSSIFCGRTNSVFKVLSKKPNTKHGANTHGAIIDEVHAIEDRELVDVITTGTIARRQPLTVYLSTAGFDKTHFFYGLYEYAKAVKENPSLDESWLVSIFEADPEKWKDPDEWRRCNPNFGITMSMDSFEQDFRLASQVPAYENTFKRLRLNIWTQQDTRAIPMERWDLCCYPEEEFPESALEKEPCFLGLDLASTTDFASASLVFPPTNKRPFFDLKVLTWFPEGNLTLRRKKLGKIDIQPWIDKGYITLTEGEVIDYDRIRATINELNKVYDIREIAIDRWNATQLSTQLDGDGFTIAPTGMGFATMNDPTKFLISLILSKKINHRQNPLLRWQAGNLATLEDAAGNLKPSKEKSKEKIDGMVATILALSRALVNPNVKSVYEERGVITI